MSKAEVEWVDRARAGFDYAVDEVWAEFAARCREIAAELFDGDPDLCCGLPRREPASNLDRASAIARHRDSRPWGPDAARTP